MFTETSNAVGFSIARLLGLEKDVPRQRYQEPTLKQTKSGVWFIRPWVDRITPDGAVKRFKETISIGSTGKREAQIRAREIMRTLNRADYVITSQIPLSKFLDEYEKLHVGKLSASTQEKYRAHLKNHIRPAFEKLRLCEITMLLVQEWLDAKSEKLSWATRTDLRNILSSIFTKAIEWGRWKDGNPIEHVHVGRKRAARQHQKLSDNDTRRLLACQPYDVRLMCCVCLFCTLRVSEALGLQEKHLDFAHGLILVRQRFYRGDLDETKSDKSRRDVPMGYLAEDLKRMCTGDPERYVFTIQTHVGRWKKPGQCRDDRDILQHFLRPSAKDLGIYFVGFGWHSLRREAVTTLGAALGTDAVMRLAGHAKADMTLHYTLADHTAEDAAIRDRQEKILGKPEGKIQ